MLISMSPPEVAILASRPGPIDNRSQFWNVSGQTTTKIGTQSHPSADRVPKDILNSQPPINILLTWTWPPNRQDPALPTSGQTAVPPTKKPPQASAPTSLTRSQTPEARGAAILQPAERSPLTQKVRQNDMAEKYVSDIGTRWKPTRTTKWRGYRQATWKRIWSNNSKDDPRSWKKNGSTDIELHEMFNKELEDLKSKQTKINNTISGMKNTRREYYTCWFVFNIGAARYKKQILRDTKGETDHNTIIMGDFSTPVTSMDRPSRQKINRETLALNDTLDQDRKSVV